MLRTVLIVALVALPFILIIVGAILKSDEGSKPEDGTRCPKCENGKLTLGKCSECQYRI